MHLWLKIFQTVSLGFSNMERVHFRISSIAWQWLEDAYVDVLLTSDMHLEEQTQWLCVQCCIVFKQNSKILVAYLVY